MNDSSDGSPSGPLRKVYFVLGALSLVLGFIGAFLPIMPTAPFVILSAYFFSRSSKKMEHWLKSHKWFGPPILRWENSGAIHPYHKATAVVMLFGSLGLMYIIGIDKMAYLVAAAVIAAAMIFIISRPNH